MQKYVYFIKYFQLLERVLNILIFGFVGGFVGGLVSRLVGGFIGGLVGRFVGGFVSGFVGGLVVVFGFAGVLDVSDEARVAIDIVRDGLTTAIGKPPTTQWAATPRGRRNPRTRTSCTRRPHKTKRP